PVDETLARTGQFVEPGVRDTVRDAGGQRGAGGVLLGRGCGRGQRGARVAVRDFGVRVLLYGVGSGTRNRWGWRRAVALRRGCAGGTVRLRGLLLSVPRPGRLRTAIRVAGFWRVPACAGIVLRSEHAGELLRVLSGDGRSGVF